MGNSQNQNNRWIHQSLDNLDAIPHLQLEKSTKITNPVFVAFMDLDKTFEHVDYLFMQESLISLDTSRTIITWIWFPNKPKDKIKIVATVSSPHNLTIVIFTDQQSLIPFQWSCYLTSDTLSLHLPPPSADILTFACNFVLISHWKRPTDKRQNALNAVDLTIPYQYNTSA